MHKLAPKQFFALTLALTTWQANAAAPSVALALAKSSIRIDSSAVTGNATILSGNVVESVGGTSELRLPGGSVTMDANARVQVFENRAELQSGKIQVRGSKLVADSGRIRVMAEAGAEAILERTNTSVVVGSLRGAVRVVDQDGALLASLHPGNALAFDSEDQGGAGTGGGNKSAKVPKRGLSAAAKTWIALGVGAGVAIPVGIVTTREGKSATVSR